MKWTAIVPVKPFAEAKTRLSPGLAPARRAQLARKMAYHVATTLHRHADIDRLVIVSREKLSGCPGDWLPDAGRGLNPALEAARARQGGPIAVFHADLPLLASEDISCLLEAAAESGLAIAPDRHEAGTNAIAMMARPDFRFRFGPDSFAAHLAEAGSPPAIIRRKGLATDCDTMEDLGLCRSLAAI